MVARRALLLLALVAPGTATAYERTAEQQATKNKTDQRAQEGALRKRADPKADLAIQKENLVKLRWNAEQDRKVGNRAGAWAAEQDIRKARRNIKKDEKQLRKEAR